MNQSSTQSPLQAIAQAEAAEAKRVEEAKHCTQEELEAFRKAETKRVEEKKVALRSKATEEIRAEKGKLGEVLQKGKDALKKEQEQLHTICEKNEKGIVTWLIEKFISLNS